MNFQRLYGSTRRCLSIASLVGMASVVFGGMTLSAAAEAAPLLRVALRPQVQVKHAEVVLDEVAVLSTTDLSLLRKAMALPLGRAPRVGDSTVLERDSLQRWLRSRMGLEAEQIVWEGAESTSIFPATRDISGEKLTALSEAALRRYIESALPRTTAATSLTGVPAAYRIELLPLAVPGELTVPAESSELKVRSLERTPVSSRMMVWVEIWAEGRHVRTVPIRFEVSVFTLAPVASAVVNPGGQLSADSWTLRETDIAGVPDARNAASVSQDFSPLNTYQRVRRKIQPGEVITAGHVQAVPAVSRGEWVSVTARSGAVSLESRAEVLQDAAVGEMVRVKPLKATASLLARVVAPGQLVLEP